MTTRRTRVALTAVAAVAGLTLAMSGCSSGDSEEKPDDKSSASTGSDQGGSKEEKQDGGGEQVLAQVKGENEITLTITSVERDSAGFVTVTGTVTNGSGSPWAPEWVGTESELAKNTSSMAGATLVDKVGKKRYLILRDTDGRCLCTRFATGVAAGETANWYAQFPAPPASTKEVTFQVGEMPPVDIKLTDK